MNHITLGSFQTFCISDASEHGIGGFNSEGIAWKLELPYDLQHYFSLNLLEFVAARITIMMTTWKLQLQHCLDGI